MANAIAILNAILLCRIVNIFLGIVAQVINCKIIWLLTGLASDATLLENFAMNIAFKLAYAHEI